MAHLADKAYAANGKGASALGMMESQEEFRPPDRECLRARWTWTTLVCGPRSFTLRNVFTCQLLKTVVLGQVLSMLICGTAVSSQYLAEARVETPMLQSFLNYTVLFLTYTTALSLRKGEENIFKILKEKWWKYFLMALTDVEANYTVVMAYQFTTITSIQLLDCFVIPVLMVLSWFFLKTRYRPVHFISVAVCMVGVGAMVGADLLAGRDQGSKSDVLLGDGLVLISAALYAVSNMCQEYTVKNLSRVEFLGMIGLFGTLISGIQMVALEVGEVSKITWDWAISLLFLAYVLCMYSLYSFMPVVVKMTSATAVNLSLLTADLFSLFCGIVLFHYKFSALYIVSFVMITVGFVLFNVIPTYTSDPHEVTSNAYQSVATTEAVQEVGENTLRKKDEQQAKCPHTESCTTVCTLKYVV